MSQLVDTATFQKVSTLKKATVQVGTSAYNKLMADVAKGEMYGDIRLLSTQKQQLGTF
jgi:hypothetical protein